MLGNLGHHSHSTSHMQNLTAGNVLPCRKPVDEFLAALRALKPSDITSVAGKMYKTPPCMATIGDITAVPRYDDVASRFR